MDNVIVGYYLPHNLAAEQAVYKTASLIRESYGEKGAEAVQAFEQMLAETPAGEIFDTETSPEKVASDLDQVSAEKLAEWSLQGQVIAQEILRAMDSQEKMASLIGEDLMTRFQTYVGNGK